MCGCRSQEHAQKSRCRLPEVILLIKEHFKHLHSAYDSTLGGSLAQGKQNGSSEGRQLNQP